MLLSKLGVSHKLANPAECLHIMCRFNTLDAIHNNCRLLRLLSVTFKVIVANSVDPDQTAPLGAV